MGIEARMAQSSAARRPSTNMGFMKPISRKLTQRSLDLDPVVVMREGPRKKSYGHLIGDGVITMSSHPKLTQMQAQSTT